MTSSDPKSSAVASPGQSIADQRREWRRERQIIDEATMPNVVFDAEPKASFDGWAFPALDDNETLSEAYKAEVRRDFEVAIDEAIRDESFVALSAPDDSDGNFLEPFKPYVSVGLPIAGDQHMEAVADLDNLIENWIDAQTGADGLADKRDMALMAQFFRRWAERCDAVARKTAGDDR